MDNLINQVKVINDKIDELRRQRREIEHQIEEQLNKAGLKLAYWDEYHDNSQ